MRVRYGYWPSMICMVRALWPLAKGFAAKGRQRGTAHPQTPHNPHLPNRFTASGMRKTLPAIAVIDHAWLLSHLSLN